ncbi:MAG: hypothetical protein FJ149_08165 [Euryarchaeota archaeon]|nr:hypothetical protein [Euryarchaeota archaeon]
MKFKVDENLPADVAGILREGGHDASTVIEQGLGGAPDAAIMEVCRREGRALVTLDLGFSGIRAYPPAAGPGCLVVRLARQDRGSVLCAIRSVLPLLKKRTVSGAIRVIDEWRVRIREAG